MKWLRAIVAVAVGSTAAGCGGAPMRVAALDEIERVRTTPTAAESASGAPEAYAKAERERALAIAAHDAHDDTLAMIDADHAIAAYEHALVVMRLAKASVEQADAQKALDEAATQVHELDAQRVSLDRDATEVEQRVQLARQRMLPAQSGPVEAGREAARLVEARSMAAEARMLCGAAKLVSGEAPGLTDAQSARTKVDDALEKPVHPVPIDDAARARVACLESLTRARREKGGDEGRADFLLTELSATGKWDPSRDERGVVVTLRGAFKGTDLADGAAAKLQELGRVAAAHPAFAVQIAVHDSQAPSTKDDGDSKRAAAASKALVDGGASAAKIDTQLPGAKVPVVDPADAKMRPRNERLEVVFVPVGA